MKIGKQVLVKDPAYSKKSHPLNLCNKYVCNVYYQRSINHDFYFLWTWLSCASREEKSFSPLKEHERYIFPIFIASFCAFGFVALNLFECGQCNDKANEGNLYRTHITYIYYRPCIYPAHFLALTIDTRTLDESVKNADKRIIEEAVSHFETWCGTRGGGCSVSHGKEKDGWAQTRLTCRREKQNLR